MGPGSLGAVGGAAIEILETKTLFATYYMFLKHEYSPTTNYRIIESEPCDQSPPQQIVFSGEHPGWQILWYGDFWTRWTPEGICPPEEKIVQPCATTCRDGHLPD